MSTESIDSVNETSTTVASNNDSNVCRYGCKCKECLEGQEVGIHCKRCLTILFQNSTVDFQYHILGRLSLEHQS